MKKQAWRKVAEQNISPQDAQAHYVQLVEKLKETHGLRDIA
jgi:acyl-CoA-binding protein